MARTNNCDASQTDLYSSLPFCAGETTLPGIRKDVFFIRRTFISAWPTVSSGKYSGNFNLASGKYFKKIQVVVDNSKFTSASQGEYPNKTFRQHLEMTHPLVDADYIDFETNANNDDLIYIVQESNGTFKVLGCEEYRTDTTFSDDSGSRATDKAGSTITAECDAPHPVMIYEGSILTGASEDANPTE